MKVSVNKHAALYAATVADCEEATLIRLARLDSNLGKGARCQLVKRYDQWITRRCRQMLGNEANAQDAAQEVRLAMFRKLGQFEGRSTLATWLNRIIHNQCISLLRKQKSVEIDAKTEQLICLYESSRRPAQQDAEAMVEAVQAVLKALPLQAREVLQLRFYKELALEEISVVLGISLSSAKMRLYRALEQFRRYFQPTDDYAALLA